MLDSFRKIGRTWFGKVLGAFLIVGLAGFGISNVLLDFGSNTIAKVGEEDITIREFQRAYNGDVSRFAQQIGRMPTPEESLAMGIPSATLGRLASEAAMNSLGEKIGIGVSDDRLSKMLREDPSFAGTLGQFDRTNFLRVLQQNGFTETEYFDLQTKAARRQQLAAGLFADSAVPEAAQELLARYSGDTRTIDYIVLNAQSIPPVAEPTEADLANYLSEHQDRFRTEETRTIDLLVLSPETLAAAKTISDQDIAAEYERTKDSRVRLEKRTIRQAPLTTPEQQAAFESGKAVGKSFDELVAEAGVDVTDLGSLSRQEVRDAALAETAFDLEAGEFAIIPGIGGQRAVTVTAIEPGGEITLEEARDEIAQGLALAEARKEYTDVLDQVEELRAAFQPLEQIAERFGLDVHTVTLTTSGAELASVPDVPETDRAEVASSVFAAEEDKLAPAVVLGANRNLWFDLKSVEAARDQTLDEVRDQIVAAWTEEKTAEALAAEVADITGRLDAGEAFADVALSVNQFPTLSQPMARSGDGTTVLDQRVAAAAFSGGEGHHGSAVNGDGDHVIFEVVEITPAGTETAAEMRAFLEETTRNSLYGDFITGLRDDAGMRVNRQTLDQVLALDSTGQ